MQTKITTLDQLEKEKQKLKMTMTVTKDAFSKSLGTNRKELKDFMIKKVALPVGAIGLGTLAVTKLTKSKESEKSSKSNNNDFGKVLFGSLVPFAFNLAQTYMLNKQSEKIEEEL